MSRSGVNEFLCSLSMCFLLENREREDSLIKTIKAHARMFTVSNLSCELTTIEDKVSIFSIIFYVEVDDEDRIAIPGNYDEQIARHKVNVFKRYIHSMFSECINSQTNSVCLLN